MTTFTIEWDMERNQGEFPPEHLGLDMNTGYTTIVANGVQEFCNKILSSLSEQVRGWEINPLGLCKLELRKGQEVYIGWIEIKY